MIAEKETFATRPGAPTADVESIIQILQAYEARHGTPEAIGVSCGGPLDSKTGVILSPPNLPGWDRVPIVEHLRKALGVPVVLQNDANACALAEYHYGAGQNSHTMVFLTFGTGLGAGIVLEGKLLRGATGNAGEVGHIRLRGDGPVGFGKPGSFEGFCSGGGLAQLGAEIIQNHIWAGTATDWAKRHHSNPCFSALDIGAAARQGDAVATEILEFCGDKLGEGLAVLIDTLNPDCIVMGSIYVRVGDLMEASMYAALRREALAANLAACRIRPAALGEDLGDYSALCLAFGAAE